MDDAVRITEKLTSIETIVRHIESTQQDQAARLELVEQEVRRHRTLLYGSATELHGDQGIVGMLRQLRTGQRATLAILTAVVIPAALAVIAAYLPFGT